MRHKLSVIVCFKLLEKSSNRRNFHSVNVSARHIHSVLEEVVAGVFPNTVDVLLPADAYMCTPRERSVEKLTTQRHNTCQQELELIAYHSILMH